MSKYKGIILAGGTGSRLHPASSFVCKQLFPIYDKPMIYYPLTSLILGGLTEILIISSENNLSLIQSALGDGEHLGIDLCYAKQEKPSGIAEALLIAEEFLDGAGSVLVLGDNLFHRAGFGKFLMDAIQENDGATVFGYPVSDPKRFGIIETDIKSGSVISLEEKPNKPKSNTAAVGLYVYDSTASEKAKNLKKSVRNELEITDLNCAYLEEQRLAVKHFSRGDFWVDAGLFDALNDASNFIRLNQNYTGMKIGSPEEASLNVGNITKAQLRERLKKQKTCSYNQYLEELING